MRPAVYASVMRNRKTGARRVNSAPHRFCKRRFCLMLSSGVGLFIPGLIVTIIGLENVDNYDNIPGDSVLYKFIGPLSLACGICLICVAGIYYCCWGFQSPVSGRHKKKHKKNKETSEQYDPLQSSTVQTISDDRKTSPHSSDRSHGNGNHSHGSVPATPDQRSGRHGNGSHRHRTSSRSSTDSRSHSRHNSRNRTNSHSNHSNHSHLTNHVPSQSHESQNHESHPMYDNQVPFIHKAAPLAQGETGSMDISIDMETPDDTKRY
ncbi:hypothetical protein ACF0H5_001512 [Mactra antiquata]